jgi:hypothetical protein
VRSMREKKISRVMSGQRLTLPPLDRLRRRYRSLTSLIFMEEAVMGGGLAGILEQLGVKYQAAR